MGQDTHLDRLLELMDELLSQRLDHIAVHTRERLCNLGGTENCSQRIASAFIHPKEGEQARATTTLT